MIREAKFDDCVDICEICTNDLGYECDKELVKYRLENLDSNQEVVYVCVVDGKVVGYIHAQKYNTLYFESMVNILGLAVAKDYRKNGFGKSLINAVEQYAKENGIKIIRLNSGTTRIEAHKFYHDLGYGNDKEQIRFLKYL